jgi:hypothetical protein
LDHDDGFLQLSPFIVAEIHFPHHAFRPLCVGLSDSMGVG